MVRPKEELINTLLPCASWYDFMLSTRRARNVGPCRGRVGDGDALEALGAYYNCAAGMSVENVPAIVNVKNTGGTIYCTQVFYWMGGGGGEEWKRRRVLLTSLQSSISEKRMAGLKKGVDKYFLMF